MLSIISGDIGSGKTALATLFALMKMSGENALIDISRLRQYVRSLNRVGHNLSQLKNHLVYTDYDVYLRKEFQRPLKNRFVDGWKIGYSNPHHETVYLPPYAFIGLDEAQMYYDSRRKYIPPFVVNYFAQHRHYHLDIVLTCQRPVSIDKAIRGLCERFIFILDLKHSKDKFGNIIHTKWQCLEFPSTESAERFSDTKSNFNEGMPTSYEYWGNIFSCYNSYGYHKYFLEGKDNQDFHCGGHGGLPQIEVPKAFRKGA
ncbi:MAG: zonular occludens toxin domain-containing protein [Firmicutes bacterium]|nr:zonular occludens toxin domain-containing protein [Bacillota bacterium]